MENATARLLIQMKTLAEPARLRLVALCRQGECSVSELARVIGQSQPRVSQHLRLLCEAGLLERFRDGRRVYYRLPGAANRSSPQARLMALIPGDDAELLADAQRLLQGRAFGRPAPADGGTSLRASDRGLYRALMELTVTAPLGDLLDIGCGRGRILKLLASRANRAVGVDIDADARELARAELLLAGLPNCSLRQGDMYRLPFADHEFDTLVLDDVLGNAARPAEALSEARRVLRPGGRVIVLEQARGRSGSALTSDLAEWCVAADLRLAPARLVPPMNPEWLVSVATTDLGQVEAA